MFDTPASGTARIGVTRQISVDGGIPPFCGEVNGHCGDGIGEACLYYNSKMEGCLHVVSRAGLMSLSKRSTHTFLKKERTVFPSSDGSVGTGLCCGGL